MTGVSSQGEPERPAAPVLRDLLPRHLPELRAMVQAHMHAVLRDRESASDLVDSICTDLLAEHVPFEYRGEGAFRAWLRVVVVNKIRRRLRAILGRGVRVGAIDATPEPVDPAASPSQAVALQEEVGLLRQALAELPQHYRELLERAHLRGQSRTEIAAAIGATEASVANMLVRARVKLAGVLDRLVGG